MKYKILNLTDPQALELAVQELIEQGWKPLGGVSVVQMFGDKTKYLNDNSSTLYSDGLLFVQAMEMPDAGGW